MCFDKLHNKDKTEGGGKESLIKEADGGVSDSGGRTFGYGSVKHPSETPGGRVNYSPFALHLPSVGIM